MTRRPFASAVLASLEARFVRWFTLSGSNVTTKVDFLLVLTMGAFSELETEALLRKSCTTVSFGALTIIA